MLGCSDEALVPYKVMILCGFKQLLRGRSDVQVCVRASMWGLKGLTLLKGRRLQHLFVVGVVQTTFCPKRDFTLHFLKYKWREV